MQDRQYRGVARGIQKLVRVPAGGERTCFRLTVSHNATDEQVRIIERSAIGVGERVAEFPTFVNRPGSFRRDVAGDSAGKGKLLEQPLHALFVLWNMRINFAV